MIVKHVFKITYLLLAVSTVVIDLIQMVLFLVNKISGLKETLDDPTFALLATLAQFLLFFLNCLSLWYFFKRADFVQYMRKVARHEYTYLFLVVFLIRFLDLYFGKGPLALQTHAVYASYLVGVAIKHWTRLSLLQLICYYKFRNEDNRALIPVKSRLFVVDLLIVFFLELEVSLIHFTKPHRHYRQSNTINNLLRVDVVVESRFRFNQFDLFSFSFGSMFLSLSLYVALSGSVTKSDAIVFVGEMLYYYYNVLLISAFLLKLKNPTKDVIRYVHKQSNADIKVIEYLDLDQMQDAHA